MLRSAIIAQPEGSSVKNKWQLHLLVTTGITRAAGNQVYKTLSKEKGPEQMLMQRSKVRTGQHEHKN